VRPTLTEFAANMRRILEDVVAPEVSAPYPAHMLRGVIANLEVIEKSWDSVLPFFEWDNAAMRTLLEQAGQQLPEPAAAGGRPFDDAYALNTELRALLARAIPKLEEGSPLRAAVGAHLAERARRYPLTWRWVAP
jgi:hypothetical protein